MELFLSHIAEKFPRENFCAVFQKNSSSKKVYGKEGGRSIKTFRRKFFVSQYRNIS